MSGESALHCLFGDKPRVQLEAAAVIRDYSSQTDVDVFDLDRDDAHLAVESEGPVVDVACE